VYYDMRLIDEDGDECVVANLYFCNEAISITAVLRRCAGLPCRNLRPGLRARIRATAAAVAASPKAQSLSRARFDPGGLLARAEARTKC
jgi:hypothetical protein